jgi:hypothetical protein
MSVDDGFSHTELELAGAPNLPAPHELVGMLRAKLEELVHQTRKGRSDVISPEDTYEMQRGLAKVIEGLEDYGRAFLKIAKEAKGYVEDELIDAVGENDGIPLSGLKVPDTDGTTIAIELDKANAYMFDDEALFQAVAWLVLASSAQDSSPAMFTIVIEAMRQLVTLGKFEPQITKVRAFTDQLSRLDGGAQIASTVTTTTHKKPIFKGIKVKREQPK